jgi:hypothetical protein
MMGLFLSAVILSVGYQLLRLWLAEGKVPEIQGLEPAGA